MKDVILDTLDNQPVMLLFILIALGYLIGSRKIRGFSLGPVAGVLFAGLAFGHFGLRMSAGTQSLGFALFIFSVGYQAGPRFFDVLRKDGLKYFLLALVVAICGFTVASTLSYLLELQPGTSAGLLAGGLTSSPTLAAAQEAIRTGSVSPPEGWTADQVIGNISTGYAITYIFGLAGLIAVIKLAPSLLKLDLPALAHKIEAEEEGSSLGVGEGKPQKHISTRTIRITNVAATKLTAIELLQPIWDGVTIGEIWRDGERLPPLSENQSIRFQLGDELVLVGPVDFFISKELKELGDEILTTSDLLEADSAIIVVNKRSAVGRSLGEFGISGNHKLLLLSIHRSSLKMPLSSTHVLSRNDILTVTGPAANIDKFGSIVGQVEREMPETEFSYFRSWHSHGDSCRTVVSKPIWRIHWSGVSWWYGCCRHYSRISSECEPNIWSPA